MGNGGLARLNQIIGHFNGKLNEGQIKDNEYDLRD